MLGSSTVAGATNVLTRLHLVTEGERGEQELVVELTPSQLDDLIHQLDGAHSAMLDLKS